MSPYDGLHSTYSNGLGKRAARLPRYLGKGRWVLEREALNSIEYLGTLRRRCGWYRRTSYWPAEWCRFQGLEQDDPTWAADPPVRHRAREYGRLSAPEVQNTRPRCLGA